MAETPHRHSADGHATDKLGHGLTKKLGPLPVWGWGLLLGVAAYLIYARMSANAASSSGTTATTSADSTTTGDLGPDSIDPNTGLTYGEEEDAAENAEAADNSASLGSGGTSESGMVPFDPTADISQIVSALYPNGVPATTPSTTTTTTNNYYTNPTDGGSTPQGSGTPSTSGTSPTVTQTNAAAASAPAVTAPLTPAQTSAVGTADQILSHPSTSGDGVPGGTLAGLAALNKPAPPPPIPKPKPTTTRRHR